MVQLFDHNIKEVLARMQNEPDYESDITWQNVINAFFVLQSALNEAYDILDAVAYDFNGRGMVKYVLKEKALQAEIELYK